MRVEDDPPEATDIERRVSGMMTYISNEKIDARLLSSNPEMIDEINIEGRTILHGCVINCKANLIPLLLQYKPNVNKLDIFSMSPLHYAAFYHNTVIFRLLCDYIQIPRKMQYDEMNRLYNEVTSILPIYDIKTDTYYGMTISGHSSVDDIQQCIYIPCNGNYTGYMGSHYESPSFIPRSLPSKRDIDCIYTETSQSDDIVATSLKQVNVSRSKNSSSTDRRATMGKESSLHSTPRGKATSQFVLNDDFGKKAMSPNNKPSRSIQSPSSQELGDGECVPLLAVSPSRPHRALSRLTSRDADSVRSGSLSVQEDGHSPEIIIDEMTSDSVTEFNSQTDSGSDQADFSPSREDRKRRSSDKESILSTTNDLFVNTGPKRTHQLSASANRARPPRKFCSNPIVRESLSQVNDRTDGVVPFKSVLMSSAIRGPITKPHLQRMYSYICIYQSSILMLKRCKNCHIYMPPRSFHCRVCDCCVRGFDHHCHWIGNCIGIRNHFIFLMFLLFSDISLILGLVISSWTFVNAISECFKRYNALLSPFVFKNSWPALLFMFFTLFFFSPITNLLLYHIRIISRNLTTHEDISLPPESVRKNSKLPRWTFYPFDEGFIRNWKYVITGSSIESHYEKEDLR